MCLTLYVVFFFTSLCRLRVTLVVRATKTVCISCCGNTAEKESNCVSEKLDLKEEVTFEADPNYCQRRGRIAISDRIGPEWEENSADFMDPSSELGCRMLILETMWDKPWEKEKMVAE